MRNCTLFTAKGVAAVATPWAIHVQPRVLRNNVAVRRRDDAFGDAVRCESVAVEDGAAHPSNASALRLQGCGVAAEKLLNVVNEVAAVATPSAIHVQRRVLRNNAAAGAGTMRLVMLFVAKVLQSEMGPHHPSNASALCSKGCDGAAGQLLDVANEVAAVASPSADHMQGRVLRNDVSQSV